MGKYPDLEAKRLRNIAILTEIAEGSVVRDTIISLQLLVDLTKDLEIEGLDMTNTFNDFVFAMSKMIEGAEVSIRKLKEDL